MHTLNFFEGREYLHQDIEKYMLYEYLIPIRTGVDERNIINFAS